MPVRGAALCVAVIVLSGCQTDGSSRLLLTGTPASATAPRAYDMFFDQGDHLEELVAAGRFTEAATLFDAHTGWFDEKRTVRYWKSLTVTADALNAEAQPKLAGAQSQLEVVSSADWAASKAARAGAQSALADYERFALLKRAELVSPTAKALRQQVAESDARLSAAAPAAFAGFDHFRDVSFFAAYPAELDQAKFLADHLGALEPKLQAATAGQLAQFARSYETALGADHRTRLGAHYVRAHLREHARGQDGELRTTLAAVRAAEAAGLRASASDLRIGFVEVTSKTLLKQGQIAFPAQVEIDMPFESGKFELDRALSNPIAETARYLIVFDVALAKASRRVTGTDKTKSRILSGHRSELNPAYDMAQLNVMQANTELANSRLMGGLIGLVAQITASNRADEARRQFAATPRHVNIPVYQDYEFDRARVHASRVMTVHYYVIDRKGGSYFKSTFDVTEDQHFSISYNVHEKDPSRSTHLAGGQSEEDLARWEDAPMVTKLSRLVAHYLDNATQSRSLPALAALREEMLRDKNAALARVEANTFKGTTQGDPRFDSVVAIYTTKGSGSGFFVAPDVVMTNHHVIEGAQFVEMKMHGGQETFGRVMATDPHRDLALVRVQARGKPVRFYARNNLELGSTIDVIGHPRRLEFSITRGIVSAVRPHKSVNIPGARSVLAVQTDAAASPGNSGGPWFLRDEVIAVTSWGRVDRGSQNLNFGVHYSEALEFMRENNLQALVQ
jgi:serine protease Do